VAGLIADCVCQQSVSFARDGGPPRLRAECPRRGSAPVACRSVGSPEGGHRPAGGACPFFLWSATLMPLLTWIGFTLSISTGGNVAAWSFCEAGREKHWPCLPPLPRFPGFFFAGVAEHDGLYRGARPLESSWGFLADPWRGWRLEESRKEGIRDSGSRFGIKNTGFRIPEGCNSGCGFPTSRHFLSAHAGVQT